MSNAAEIDHREERDAATALVAEYEAGNLHRHQADAMVLEQFANLDLDADVLEAIVAPFRQALNDIDKAKAARESPARESQGHRSRRRKSRGTSESAKSTESDGDSSSEEESDDDGKAGAWPWSRGETKVDRELAKTIQLRRRYRAKFEKAKDAIVTSVGAPVFPETLWGTILKHGYVDFDKLNGAHFSAVNEEEGQPATIGDYTIRLKGKSATKPVVSSTDWLYCYETYERAVVWAFKHRKAELRAYYGRFHQLFRSYATSAHVRLINLDRAIRSEVAASSTLKLTDDALFSRLREQYLSVDGAGYQISGGSSIRTAAGGSGGSNGGGPSRQRTKVREPCRQWNNGRCSRPSNSCLFLHQCMECNGTHPRLDCPQTKSGGGGRVDGSRQ
jgi:hypothetical protein